MWRIASMTFDFPLPLRPITAFSRCGPPNRISAFSRFLNPDIQRRLNRIGRCRRYAPEHGATESTHDLHASPHKGTNTLGEASSWAMQQWHHEPMPKPVGVGSPAL